MSIQAFKDRYSQQWGIANPTSAIDVDTIVGIAEVLISIIKECREKRSLKTSESFTRDSSRVVKNNRRLVNRLVRNRMTEPGRMFLNKEQRANSVSYIKVLNITIDQSSAQEISSFVEESINA